MKNLLATVLAGILVSACQASRPAPATPADAFWAALQTLCGSAFEGRIVEAAAADTAFTGKPLVMHVRGCARDTVFIAFNVGDNRSRTWVLTRTGDGLRLKHDHRHEDGSEDRITQYGGDTRGAGKATQQEFHADAHTVSLIPAAATNVWTVEVAPGRFVYALRREGTERRFRVEFDTTRPVPAPLPSWGH
jgi:hypothetical protein